MQVRGRLRSGGHSGCCADVLLLFGVLVLLGGLLSVLVCMRIGVCLQMSLVGRFLAGRVHFFRLFC